MFKQEDFQVAVVFSGNPVSDFDETNIILSDTDLASISSIVPIPSDATETNSWILYIDIEEDVSGIFSY